MSGASSVSNVSDTYIEYQLHHVACADERDHLQFRFGSHINPAKLDAKRLPADRVGGSALIESGDELIEAFVDAASEQLPR